MIRGTAAFYSSPEAAKRIGVTANKFRYLHNLLPLKPIITNGGKNHSYLWPAWQVDKITPAQVSRAVAKQKGKKHAAQAAAGKAHAKRKYVRSGKYAKKAQKTKYVAVSYSSIDAQLDRIEALMNQLLAK